jgi:hypothetical protein
VEFSKRPSTSVSRYNPHHVITPITLTLEEALSMSDVVISAVPSKSYKVETRHLKDGCVCVNVAGDKNFEDDVRGRVRVTTTKLTVGIHICSERRCNDHRHVAEEFVSASNCGLTSGCDCVHIKISSSNSNETRRVLKMHILVTSFFQPLPPLLPNHLVSCSSLPLVCRL